MQHVPSALTSVAVGRARLAVESRGAGEPAVVCLHAGVADRRMWRRQDPADYGRLVAFDRRGFGDTVAEPEPWSPVADTVAVLDALGLGSVVLMGCSQGGRVAIDLALAHPERVRALVLVAPAVSGAPDGDIDPTIVAEYESAEQSGDLVRMNRLETRLWLDGPTSAEGRVGGEVRDLVLDMNGRALRAPPVGEARWPEDSWDQLERIAAPTLVVWGSLDFGYLQDRCETLVRRIPGARGVGVALDGVAHLPNLEDPARFDPPVTQFLQALGGGR